MQNKSNLIKNVTENDYDNSYCDNDKNFLKKRSYNTPKIVDKKLISQSNNNDIYKSPKSNKSNINLTISNQS